MRRFQKWMHEPASRMISATLLLLALTVFFFRKILLGNQILIGVDSFLYFYPYRQYVSDALLAGRLPLWNPGLFMGAPLLANMQTAVLYPLWWPLTGMFVPKQMAWMIGLHVALAMVGTLLYARRSLGLGWVAGLAAAATFGLGGYLGAQVEHINQLSCIAWFPWMFLLLDTALGTEGQAWRSRRFAAVLAGLGMVIALMILAGHAQTVFLGLVGAGGYGLVGGRFLAPRCLPRKRGDWLEFLKRRSLPYLLTLGLAVALALALTAVQLLPTVELSGLSVRSGGLSYRDVTSFSLQPWRLLRSILPPYGVDLSQVLGEAFGEYVAYVGILALPLAGVGVWSARKRPGVLALALVAGVGVFLAMGRYNPFYYMLYRLVPGFALFRAPVRWIVLYAFGTSLLAGAGLETVTATLRRRFGLGQDGQPVVLRRLREHAPSAAALVLLGVLVAELNIAAQGLRFNRPTAPEAFSAWRPSIAHLKVDDNLFRFLSLSGIVYDPGDLKEMEGLFAGQLPEQAIYDYVVAAKEKEVLFYNLPLLFGLQSVDGYDGGLLPTQDFVTLQRLFLPGDRLSTDGRLRENLDRVPEGRLLSLLGVKYVITDKVFDVWIDDVFYDLQFEARLGPHDQPAVESGTLKPFPSTAVGVVSFLERTADLVDGTPVARVTLADDTGWEETFLLLAGRDTSEGVYLSRAAAHAQARVGHTWLRDDGEVQVEGNDYIAVLSLGEVRQLTSVRIEGLLPTGTFVLRGVSRIDDRTGSSQQVLLSTEGDYKLVHSGDVKIYQNLDVLSRAFFVGSSEVIPDAGRAVERLRDTEFDPTSVVILEHGAPVSGGAGATGVTRLTKYVPEEVVVDVQAEGPGFLVLTDSFYPGWQATVAGRPAEILKADLAFRAVAVPGGAHTVVFRYIPTRFWWGVGISAAALVLCLGMLLWRR